MTKIYYKGVPLAKYCRENNVIYKSVVTRMREKRMTPEEAVETLYKNRWIMKCSDGTPLIKKCKDKAEYSRMYRRMTVKRMNAKEAEEAELRDNHCKYFYKGIPIVKYGKDKKECYKIRERIRRGVPVDIAVSATRKEILRWRKQNEN